MTGKPILNLKPILNYLLEIYLPLVIRLIRGGAFFALAV